MEQGYLPSQKKDDLLSCELLWIAQSHSGDYHDNINSDMFMKWVKERLVPTFQRKYPGKKMILVADNAPYHHKRDIGSLGSLSKKQMLELMRHHNVEWLDIPLTTDERLDLVGREGEEDYRDVQDRRDCVRINFRFDEQMNRAFSKKTKSTYII